jgi:hypothetical protein
MEANFTTRSNTLKEHQADLFLSRMIRGASIQ